MTEAFSLPDRARLFDLFRPRRLFAGIAFHPTFVFPALLFVLCVVTYTQTALGPALPRLVPILLAKSQWTESELAGVLRSFFLVLAVFLPLLFLILTTVASWALLAVARTRQPLVHLLSLLAHVSLWVGLGFLTKALLVKLTGQPEPAANLSFFLGPVGTVVRVVLAFTNPFLLLALVWTARGLRAWGTSPAGVAFGGVLPWAAWIVFFAVAGGGAGTRFVPTGPVFYEGWRTIERETVTLLHPPGFAPESDELATLLDGFARKLAAQFEFEPRPIRVHVYPDHPTLERATGEFLHVRVAGSIRGQQLVYLELPGRSAAIPQEQGLRDAMRYVGLMQLAPVATGAPRWFVEGLAHAATFPYSPVLEREYLTVVRRVGMPTYEMLFDNAVYRTPDGPMLARSLVDFIAFRYGRETPAAIFRDVLGGSSFRDALFARTRLTTSALEVAWQDHVSAALARPPDTPPEEAFPGGTAADSAAVESVQPFRPRR